MKDLGSYTALKEKLEEHHHAGGGGGDGYKLKSSVFLQVDGLQLSLAGATATPLIIVE